VAAGAAEAVTDCGARIAAGAGESPAAASATMAPVASAIKINLKESAREEVANLATSGFLASDQESRQRGGQHREFF